VKKRASDTEDNFELFGFLRKPNGNINKKSYSKRKGGDENK
jgi:hypothetical protein